MPEKLNHTPHTPETKRLSLMHQFRDQRDSLRNPLNNIADPDLKAEAQSYVQQIQANYSEHSGRLSAINQVSFDNLIELSIHPVIQRAQHYQSQLSSANKEETLIAFKQEADKILKDNQQQIKKIVSERGWLGEGEIDHLHTDMRERATLLSLPEHNHLKQAYLSSIGQSPEPLNPKELAHTIVGYYQYPQLSPLLWPITKQLTPNQRIDLLLAIKETTDQNTFKQIINRGNQNGVFSGEEIESVLEDITPEQLKQYSQNWELKNTIRDHFYYTNGESVEEMMSLGGLGRLTLKTWGLATLSANFLASIATDFGELKQNPLKIVDRVGDVVKNEWAWAGLGTYLGVKAYEKPEPILTAQQQNDKRFRRLIGSRYHNKQWEDFMENGGIKALNSFSAMLKKRHEGLLPEDRKITTKEFQAYLSNPDEHLKEQFSEKKTTNLLRQFSKMDGSHKIAQYLKMLEEQKISDIEQYYHKKQKTNARNV